MGQIRLFQYALVNVVRRVLCSIVKTIFLDSVAVPLPSSGLVVTAHCDSCSPAQLLVQWEALLIFGSAIAYEIHYSGEEFDTDLHSINASGSVNFTVLDNLEEFLVYDVQIRAYYQDGPGPFFPSQSARTYAGLFYLPCS